MCRRWEFQAYLALNTCDEILIMISPQRPSRNEMVMQSDFHYDQVQGPVLKTCFCVAIYIFNLFQKLIIFCLNLPKDQINIRNVFKNRCSITGNYHTLCVEECRCHCYTH